MQSLGGEPDVHYIQKKSVEVKLCAELDRLISDIASEIVRLKQVVSDKTFKEVPN